MKLSETLYEAMSEIDEELLKRSEEPRVRFSLKKLWMPVMAMAMILCLAVLPRYVSFQSGSAAHDEEAKTNELQPAETVTDSCTLPDNVTLSEEAALRLKQDGAAAVKITAETMVSDARADTAARAKEMLEKAELSAEVRDGACFTVITWEDLERIEWPQDLIIRLDAE